jgi:7-carboxy-7-deazaguanine synthase
VIGSSDGYVHEVFRSIQGEGPYVGVLQAFVRFSGCSSLCCYCDSEEARNRVAACALHCDGESRCVPNPIAADEIVSFIRALAGAPGFHSVSITGGEPLEQPEFLAAVVARLHADGIPIYLETNGLHTEAARMIAGSIDFVALDIKLPSLCPGATLETYPDVLPLFEGSALYCKVVVAEGFSMEELAWAARIVERYDRSTIFVIQPATPSPACDGISPRKLLACHAAVSNYLDDVRVIPQCHRLTGFR